MSSIVFNPFTNNLDFLGSSGNNATSPSSFMLANQVNPIDNVTGDGTSYTVVYDTLVVDTNNRVTDNNNYSAPFTGMYLFNITLEISGLTDSHTQLNVTFFVNNTTSFSTIDVGNIGALQTSGVYSVNTTVILPLSAGETVRSVITVYGGAKTVNVLANSNYNDSFSGYFIQSATL